jgi:hypothetical protein
LLAHAKTVVGLRNLLPLLTLVLHPFEKKALVLKRHVVEGIRARFLTRFARATIFNLLGNEIKIQPDLALAGVKKDGLAVVETLTHLSGTHRLQVFRGNPGASIHLIG